MIRLRKLKSSQDGFTLVEIVAVSALLGVLFLLLWGTLNGIIQAKKIVEAKGKSVRTGRYLIERMGREISGCAAERVSQVINKKVAGALSSDFMQGLNKSSGETDQDSIRFVSAGGGQAVVEGAGNFGIVEIGYRLEEPEEKDRNRNRKKKSFLLIREEIPGTIENKDLKKEKKIVFPVASDLAGLNLRYFDQGKWQDSWERKPQRLPSAVEITLRLFTSEDSDEIISIKTAVSIEQIVSNKRSFRPRNLPTGLGGN